jgi:hypothetical protein
LSRLDEDNGVSGLILVSGLYCWFSGADSVGLFDSGESDEDGNVSSKPQLRLLLDHLAVIKDTRQPWKVAYPLRARAEFPP